MQNRTRDRKGIASMRTNSAKVSAQKTHTGPSRGEKAQKNSVAPPAAPSTMKPRSTPSPRRRRKRKAAQPTARQ